MFHPTSRTLFTITRIACAVLVLATVIARADAAKPPASGLLFDGSAPDALSQIKVGDGMTTSLAGLNGEKMIKIDFSKLEGYPGIDFPIPAGGWDLGGFTGAQVVVNNPGKEALNVNLKVLNDGDWKLSPWSVEFIVLKPGETQTLKVVFGEAFHHPAFKLDPAHVTGIRLFILPPKSAASLLVGKLTVFKDEAAVAAPTASPTTTTAATPAAPPPPPPPPPPPLFTPPTPAIDIAGKRDFPNASALSDDAATQLKGLCSLAEFQALPETDRHVYSFDVWPSDKDSLGGKQYVFNFHLGTEGVTSQKVAFLSDGGGAGSTHSLGRTKDPASGACTLTGFGNLDWSGKMNHTFKFDKPVTAFGVVLRATGDIGLRKFYWASNKDNGYPVSYTLADGSIIQLGEREKQGALLKGGTDNFVGVIDRSGHGIVSVSYTIDGLAGNKGEGIGIAGLAFATLPKPAVAPVINLKSSSDFYSPESITPKPTPPLDGLASLDDFRFIVANHRYVYDFGTWPQAKPDLDSNTATFSFDLKGKGEVGEKVTVTAINAAKSAKLTQATLKDEEGLPYHVLGGLGDIGNGAWSEQTFKFSKPVWAFGVTYSSPADLKLATAESKDGHPTGPAYASYTLSDGTIRSFASSKDSDGLISANKKTFVGVRDTTDKGITSVTFRVQGTTKGPQPLYIDDLAFALAGPPPGHWKLTMDDEFNGDKLNPAYWTTGYTFPDVINNEMQAYVPENVTVNNGVATIKVEHRVGVNTDRTGRTGATQQFASGAFTSYDKFTQTYGYFEARIKMPHPPGAGVWPAFWMLADRGKDYPKNIRSSYKTHGYGMGSEIDIFEFMPWWQQLDGLFPIHCGTIWSYGKVTPADPAPHGYGSYALANDGWGPAELHYPRADTEFHTYGIYWSPQRLIFYLDSKPFFRVRDSKNIPDVPEYFLFNIALSGNGWGKNPGGKQPTLAEITADMPNEMQIDYFRAYSGTLEEDVPTPPEDIPGPVNKYSPTAPALPPPAPGSSSAAAAPATPAPAPKTNATPATPATPAAPINSTITTPPQ